MTSPWIWAASIVVMVAFFAFYETYCLMHNQPTLSRSVWVWSEHFPLLPPLVGLVVGGLMVHFFWEGGYCAPNTPVLSYMSSQMVDMESSIPMSTLALEKHYHD